MIKKILEKTVGNLKFFSYKSLIIAISIVTIIYINYPRLHPNIEIENDPIIHLRISSDVGSFEIHFKNQPKVLSYTVFLISNNLVEKRIINNQAIGKNINHLLIDISDLEIPKRQNLFIDILTAQKRLTLTEIRFDGDKQNLKHFIKNNLLNKTIRYENKKIARKEISELLLSLNEVVGNYVLTFILILCFPLFYVLLHKFYMFLFDNRFSAYIRKRYLAKNHSNNQIRSIFVGKYLHEERIYSFLSIMGPAIGFLLTVSSLIAGLHPRLISPDKFGYFLQSIQLAMVSTFLGLFIRIEALSILAINRNLLTKFEVELEKQNHEND